MNSVLGNISQSIGSNGICRLSSDVLLKVSQILNFEKS